jgi:hypothetical protein
MLYISHQGEVCERKRRGGPMKEITVLRENPYAAGTHLKYTVDSPFVLGEGTGAVALYLAGDCICVAVKTATEWKEVARFNKEFLPKIVDSLGLEYEVSPRWR